MMSTGFYNIARKQLDNRHEQLIKSKSWKEEVCMHDVCQECHGTGRKADGSGCVHMISCPCSRCSPARMMVVRP